ncbi:mRNA export factor rae-1 [Ditylenchus destructor]|uniref:mRNA export factor rae-1 n=1 Tax=Ditylenchus destructor TaxID=166010 RepID=A0AAD4MNY4_9BILA|nr:mRNA export factor rae-1 [Ditylenchus destructor]
MFGSPTASPFGANRPGGLFGSGQQTSSTLGSLQQPQQQSLNVGGISNPQNPNNDLEVPNAPDDAVQALRFNPQVSGMPILLAAGSWDNTCRVWQVQETGAIEPKAQQNIGAPILALDWTEDGTKVFIAGADKQARIWDLASNQVAIVGTHDEAVRVCHWITSPNYNCLMTGSWDRTLRFWDMRQLPTQNSLATIQLPERVYCSDMLFPMAVVGLANRHIKMYKLDGQPQEISDIESPLKFQSRCISIFQNKMNNQPHGYALGSIEGRVAIQYAETSNPKDNFTFKCHRSGELINNYQEIYPVNDVAFHPQHNTLATVGSDGRYSYWDKDARTKLKNSEALPMPITKCHVHASGNIFAYAVGYDWSKGHEANVPGQGSKIFLHPCSDEMKARPKK